MVSWLIHKATQVDIWRAITEEQLKIKIKVDPISVFTMHEHAYTLSFFIRVCSVRISRIIIIILRINPRLRF